MYYYQDFMDGLNTVPQEMVNGLAQMRDLDIKVQDSMDATKNNVDTLFSNADNMSQKELDTKFHKIMQEGKKNAVAKSEQKIDMVNKMHGLLSKFMKRLDNDILKFKTDLEANNSGITDIIEKRLVDSENINITGSKSESSRYLFGVPETRKKSRSSKRHSVAKRSPVSVDVPLQCDTSPATSQNDVSSLVYSFKQIDIETPLTTEGTSASGAAAQLVTSDADKTMKHERPEESQTSDEDVVEKVNPDDARFCICNEVAYGSMVACDNEKKCPYEWYHYECVGITVQPKGAWYCPQCRVKNRNLKRRSKK